MRELIISPRIAGKTNYALDKCKEMIENIEDRPLNILFIAPRNMFAKDLCRKLSEMIDYDTKQSHKIEGYGFTIRFTSVLIQQYNSEHIIDLLVLDEFDFFHNNTTEMVANCLYKKNVKNILATTTPTRVRSREEVLDFLNGKTFDLLLELYFNPSFAIKKLKRAAKFKRGLLTDNELETEYFGNFIGI